MADRPRRVPLETTVARTELLTEAMVRVVLAGGDLARFEPSGDTDSYVKLVFTGDRLRTYTVRAWDPDALELTIDVVVHGDEGLAGPWARAARPGDPIGVVGPGGGYAPDPAADWHLLAGDESVLPAIAVALERLPDDATVHAFVEVDDDSHRLPVDRVTWLVRGEAPPGTALVPAVTGLAFPPGRVHGFVHGEAGFVRDLRRHLIRDRGIPLDQLSVSGYWRLGKDDEGWRAVKRDWNREIEESERTMI
jgi:NADPH-dependent ferric siderophore reductase